MSAATQFVDQIPPPVPPFPYELDTLEASTLQIPLAATPPPTVPWWFYALDQPLRWPGGPPLPPAPAKPTSWAPFSKRHNTDIEAAYNTLCKATDENGRRASTVSPRVAVNDDLLYEVDVEKKEISPIYWLGPIYEVRRGTWFYAADNSRFLPCEEKLARQIEDGYRKFQPWKDGPTPPAAPTSISSDATATPASVSPPKPPPERRWILFGPYANQSVIYTESATAYLQYDVLSAKLARAVITTFSKGTPGGIRLIRGWDEVEKFRAGQEKPVQSQQQQQQAQQAQPQLQRELSAKASKESLKGKGKDDDVGAKIAAFFGLPDKEKEKEKENGADADGKEKVEEATVQPPETAEPEKIDDARVEVPQDDAMRPITHLVFVIHGIGQKLGEKLGAVNFVGDVNIFRQTLRTVADQYFPTFGSEATSPSSGVNSPPQPGPKAKSIPKVPSGGGVQVLPIHWRQKMAFGRNPPPPPKPRATGAKEGTVTSKEAVGADTFSDLETVKTMQEPEDLSIDIGPSGVKRQSTGLSMQQAEDELEEAETHLDDITLEGVPTIRTLISDVVLDVLLYMTPRFRQQMVRHLTRELNSMYKEFKERNPKFNGTVSLYGHSLGSVLAFDILCNQKGNASDGEKNEDMNRSEEASGVDLGDVLGLAGGPGKKRSSNGLSGLMRQERIEYEELDFEVDKLFAVGSPVGIFLLLRGDKLRARMNGVPFDPKTEIGSARPKCKAVYNIFHPHDPVAYRMEPIVSRIHVSSKPVFIQYTKGGLKGTIVGIQEASSGLVDKGISIFESMRTGLVSTTQRMVAGLVPNNATKYEDEENAGKSRGSSPSRPETGIAAGEVLSDTDLRALNPTGRLDYSIQEGVLENPYLSALGSHMTYWNDTCVSLFILRELHAASTPAGATGVSMDGRTPSNGAK
ncbi:DDHD domain-containing protein [Cladochytrium replicatum]|nr:DDHD domain-containing protein [Cladochytrium replicatum]